MRLRPPEFVAAAAGGALVCIALVIIWAARASVLREAYVSELGAVGEPTAKWFEGALLLIVVGGSAIAWAGRGIRSAAWIFRRWTPALSLWIGCAFFLVASQVTCTAGCPLPVGATFTWQDFAHTAAAVVAFASACVAMLQASFAEGERTLAKLSLASGVAVAATAAAGGILSLARLATNIGSVLELVATTIALGWLVSFGAVVASRTAGRPPALRLSRGSMDARAQAPAEPQPAHLDYGVGIPPLTFNVSPTTKLDSGEARKT